MHTIRLIYSSKAREGLVYRDFLEIMDHAAEANNAKGITGMLCYGGGMFLQALEGERSAVNTLYHYIATDLRHTDCQLLLVEELQQRDFAEWSMKIIDWSDARSASRRTMLLKHSASALFAPTEMSGRQALSFLQDLAAQERALLE